MRTEGNARKNMTFTVIGLQSFDLQGDTRRNLACCHSLSQCFGARADINFSDALIVLDTRRVSFKQNLTLIHDGNAVSNRENTVYIVLH